MSRFKNFLERIITYPIRREVENGAKYILRNIEAAPTCCSEPMEFIGEHSGHRLNTQFYQCSICMRVELAHKRDWEK